MKTLKMLGAALAAVTMAFTAQAAKTAKAVITDGGKTLKFVYDDVPPSGMKGTDWFRFRKLMKRCGMHLRIANPGVRTTIRVSRASRRSS